MPWGFWIVKLARHDDVRRYGSGNTGATNVWRAFGPRLGLVTALLDIAKGCVPALIGELVFGPGTAVLAGAAAQVGHTFPIFLGLGGGKGVATGAGVMLAICPLCLAVSALTWFGTLWLFRYVSVASMAGAVAFVAASLVFSGAWEVVVFALFATVVVFARHRPNIGRLRAGTEPRVRSFGRGAPSVR
jgi:glycerol-3-phosphate acyltransferase PlsY